MSKLITRRGLIRAGWTAAAGAAGIGSAAALGNRFGLIPPNYASMTGIGETLTYSTQRLLTSGNSLAREFTRAALDAPVPVLLGGHGIVAGSLWALTQAAWDRADAGTLPEAVLRGSQS